MPKTFIQYEQIKTWYLLWTRKSPDTQLHIMSTNLNITQIHELIQKSYPVTNKLINL